MMTELLLWRISILGVMDTVILTAVFIMEIHMSMYFLVTLKWNAMMKVKRGECIETMEFMLSQPSQK